MTEQYYKLPYQIGFNTNAKGCTIGKGTKVWNYANLFYCKIGKDCTIGSYVEIGKDVVIGDQCKIEAYTFIPTGVKIGNRVFIGPHVVFTNDKFPRAMGTWKLNPTIVEDDVSIGANSTILSGITLGEDCMVGAGSIVTKTVKPHTVVYGDGAKLRGTIH